MRRSRGHISGAYVLFIWQSRSSETMVQRNKTSSVSILFEMVDPCYEIIDMELSSYVMR